MAKKPSEWTAREAWDTLHKRVVKDLFDRGWKDAADVIRRCEMFAFPSDPPERVSDEMLSALTHSHDKETKLMALELIERRKADGEKR